MENVQLFIQNNIIIVVSIFLVLFIILIIWNISLNRNMSKLKRKNEEFFAGGKVHNLEELLLSQIESLKLLDRDIQELFNISNKINNLAGRGIHKVGLVRFNPFRDVGGDQSFALALLNGKNNGITISSLYTREGTRVYSKSIINGQSEKHPLTEEEKEAIRKAMENDKSKVKNQDSKMQIKNQNL